MYLASSCYDSGSVGFKLKQIPRSIQDQYQLHSIVDHHGYVYAKIKKALYGLKESGRIAHEDMIDHLASFGYHESKFTKGPFKHDNRDISFTLVVDFGLKWTKEADLNRLISALKQKYEMK